MPSKRVLSLLALLIVAVTIVLVPIVWRLGFVGGRQLALNRRLVNAVLKNDTPAVKAALNAGADPNAEMEGWAVTDFVHPLVNAMTGDMKKHLRDTPLLLVMDCLVDRDVKATDGDGIPLENLATVRALVEGGADINARNNIGDTTLTMATAWGYDQTSRYLLSQKADPNIGEDGGTTPLHNSSTHGNVGLTVNLIDHGANVNTRDCLGDTPLLWTGVPPETPGRIATAKILIEHGADTSVKNEKGRTALAEALNNGRHPGIVKLLQQHGAK